jgi:NADH-quinone oxidoreductase subunit M
MSTTTLAVLVPLAAALVVGAVPRSEPGLARALGLLGCLVELVVIATMLLGWDPEGAAVQQWIVQPWLPSFGVAWSLGLDGTVLAPLLVIGLVFPLALLIGPRPRQGEPPVLVGMLVLQSAWVAVLLARDLVVLATCWEIATVTMVVLLGERGDGKLGVPGRTAAARRFAAHVLPGAAALIAAVALLGVAHSHASGGSWSWDIDEIAQVVMPARLQGLGFVLVMITLAAALPLVPLQGWLGPVGASGPTPVLAVLTGVGMPMAVILAQRVVTPMFPLTVGEWADPLAAIALVGAGYAALACWAEREPGRLLGHAALLHLSLAIVALLSGTVAGRLALGPIVLAQGVGLSLLALVFGWLRRREISNLGELAGRSKAAHQRAVDEFHRARCLAIEAREQPRPLLRDELVSLCLDPAARIRQVYGLDEEAVP